MRPVGRAWPASVVVAGGQKVGPVPVGLDEQEGDVEAEAGERDEGELDGRIEGAGHGDDGVGQHENENSHRDQDGEEGVGALDAELGLLLSEGADDDAEAGQPVQHQHDDGMHRVAQQRRVRLAAQHHRDDEPDLDDGHGKGEDEGAERLAHPQRHDLGVMHGGDHVAEEEGGDEDGEEAEADLPTTSHAARPSTGRTMVWSGILSVGAPAMGIF